MAMSSQMSDSDSDLSLPDINEIFPPPSTEIKRGEFVWAQYKGVHWPAYVTSVLKKQKKVSVWFTDQPGTIFKVPISKVYHFRTEKYGDIKNEALAAGCIGAHEDVKSYVSLFLNRRKAGCQDNPLKFFDPTYPYLLVEDYLEKNPSSKRESFATLRIPHILVRNSIPASTVNQSVEKECPDIEPSSETESKPPETRSIFANLSSELSSDEMTYVQKIIDCIKSGKSDAYLQRVLNGKVQSFYADFYEKCHKSKKFLLNYISYGPINNLDHLRELILYLSSLFEKTKLNKNGVPPASLALVNSDFIAHVWLPEAIIYAMSSAKQISLKKGYKLFHESSRLKSSYLKFIQERRQKRL